MVPTKRHIASTGWRGALAVFLVAVIVTGAGAQPVPDLPPAAFKPLPVGTKIRYDDRNMVVTESDGFRNVFRVWTGGRKTWLSTHAVFGESAPDLYVYHGGGGQIGYEMAKSGRRALEGLWPLSVGKSAQYRIAEGAVGLTDEQTWTIDVKVAATERIQVKGFLYSTFVVAFDARSTGGMSFTRRAWYEPNAGIIVKSTKRWTGKRTFGPAKVSYLDRDEEEVFELVEVGYPAGSALALKGDKAAAGVPDELRAELERLKQTVQEVKSASQTTGEATPTEIADIRFGTYHALVIGIDAYKYLPKLTTAVRDAQAVAKVLTDDYGFKVTLLTNPTRVDIIDALDTFRETLGADDNLLIYYAGHGWLDEDADRGYWLPVNAKPNRRARWVSNATITDTLKTLQAKHVMVVADSCYSGTLTRSATIGLRSGDYFKRMAKKWARVALVSGGLEPVADKGGGGHSPFARAFIGALRQNPEAVIDGTQLFNTIRRPVMVSAEQTPEYSDVRNAGHDGGDFLFVKRK